MSESPDNLQKLLDFLDQLEQRNIYFELARCRSEAIMVCIDVPGERWEVEFIADGTIETEVFRSEGVEAEETGLDRLFREFSG